MTACKYVPCSAEFAPVNDGHVFHSRACKAAWHRDQLFKNGVPVTVVQIRTSKKGINAMVRIEHKDREELAKIADPGSRLFLIAIEEGVIGE